MVFKPSFLTHLYRDDAAVFRVSSMEMVTWFSSDHPWRLYRDGAGAIFSIAP